MNETESSELQDIVLFADDDPALCQLWAYLLSEHGLDVTLATTGADALAAACARRPKIAILDMWMPRMSGLVVCRQMKRDPTTKDIFVVIMTGDDDPKTRKQALEAGADEFLLKPIEDDHLVSLVLNTAGVCPLLTDAVSA